MKYSIIILVFYYRKIPNNFIIIWPVVFYYIPLILKNNFVYIQFTQFKAMYWYGLSNVWAV